MPLEFLLERNRAFVTGRKAQPLPPAPNITLAVVGCYDPRLDTLLLPALGLQPGQAFLLRTAGALVQPAGGVMRSLAMGIFMFGVTEVVVVGHSSCRMATFETSAFVDAFRRRGVAREAFGAMDLRDWACAIPDPQRGVAISIANISAAPFLPKDVAVSGVVLDDTTGALTVVAPGREQGSLRPTETDSFPASVPAERPEPPAPAPPAAAHPPPVQPSPSTGALDYFVTALESVGRWPDDARRLRKELAAERNPIAQLKIVKAVAHRAVQESTEVARAYEVLKRRLTDTGGQ